jgi:YHS domain-containing protein
MKPSEKKDEAATDTSVRDEGGAAVIDPVCGMTVKPESAAASYEHDGMEYYFCSPHCRNKFQENPKAFLQKAPEPSSSPTVRIQRERKPTSTPAPQTYTESAEKHPLGVSPFILGKAKTFKTRQLTLEFKNNLDRLIEDVVGPSPKSFGHIDVCVCWGKVGDSFKGYELEPVAEAKLDVLRSYPGITHVLTRDGDTHVVAVIMLQTITAMIGAGQLTIPVTGTSAD